MSSELLTAVALLWPFGVFGLIALGVFAASEHVEAGAVQAWIAALVLFVWVWYVLFWNLEHPLFFFKEIVP